MLIDISLRAQNLGLVLDGLADEVEEQLQVAIQRAVTATKAYGEELARSKLKTSQKDYVDSLDTRTEGKTYYITLEGDFANSIEDGWPARDMKDGFVNGPNSTVGKNGSRYNTIPFRIQPFSKAKASPKMTDIRSAANQLIKARKINKIIKDEQGNPLKGYYDAAKKSFTGQRAARLTNTGSKFLEGLTKTQYPYEKSIQSTYQTFRRVSSNSPSASWLMPAFEGAKIFPQMEVYLNNEIDNIFINLLS